MYSTSLNMAKAVLEVALAVALGLMEVWEPQVELEVLSTQRRRQVVGNKPKKMNLVEDTDYV